MNSAPLTIPRLHVGAGTTVGALTAFPLWVEAPSVHGLHWSGSQLSVSELETGPSVGELVIENRSPRPAVVLEGDLVEGGWQNRMLAVSALLAAGATSEMPALCVEQGRWHGARTHRTTGRRASYTITAAERDTDDLADQDDVWRRIEGIEEELGRTASASLVEHLEQRPAPRLPLVEGQRGVIIGIGGQVVAAEIFGRSRGLRSRWCGIIDAAWLDAARAPEVAMRAEQARAFVRRLGSVPLNAQTAAGIGRRIVAGQDALSVHGLVTTTDQVVHLAAVDTAHPYVLAA